MRSACIILSLLLTFYLKAQENYPVNKLPVFKQITHPFMPPITSEYFFFSEDGFIWFSTAQGLTSFDGSEVTNYSSLQLTNAFGLNRIFAMAEDKLHNFYIGTPIGLFYYDRKARSFKDLAYTFRDSHRKPNIAFDALYCDAEDLVYAGAGSNGLFIYDPVSQKLDHFNLDAAKTDSWSDLNLNTVKSLAAHATDTNKLWVGSFHGIYLFDKKTKTFGQQFEVTNPGHYLPAGNIPEHYDIQKMDVANDSTIWFNSWVYGFGKYNIRTGKVKMFLNGTKLKTPSRNIGYIIPRFARLSPGKYLLGIYDYKTAIFDCQTEDVQYFTVTNNNYEQEQTRFVANDRQGNTWLLQRGLLYIAVPDNIRLQEVEVPNFNKIGFPQLRGICFDKKSNFFYCAFLHANGVQVFDTVFRPVKTIPVPLINNYYTYNTGVVNNITKDSVGRFWTAGPENYVLLPGARQFVPVEKAFPSLKWTKTKDGFTDLKTTRKGDLLYMDDDGIAYHIRHPSLKADTIRPPEINTQGVEINVSSQWYDAKRNFIYLIRNSGMARYDLNNNHTAVIPYKSLFGNLPLHSGICTFALNEDGRIWFMIPKYGIRVINPETLNCEDSIPYGTKGLIRGDYTNITGAEKPFILLRSRNGVVVYDYLKQQSFLFDHDNGLSSPDNKSLLYCNGYMLIGEDVRFEYFKLSNLKNYIPALKPRINTIVSDTSLIYLNSGNDSAIIIRLPYYQNSISISFSAQEFIFPERIEYAYQLTPLDHDWHYTNYFNRKIPYTRLAPGKYTFQLKAQMQGGNWDTRPIKYIIIITPAWWQAAWFKILCVLIGGTIIIYFIQRRIQFVRKTEQQKSKHEKELWELEAKALRAQMNPHFIFNCLNSIKSLIQANENEKSVTYLTTFSKLIRTLLNNADKKEISLYDEIETCKLYLQLEAMRFDEKFSYAVNIDHTIDLKSILVPALIIQPFIENAIWHGIVPGNTGGHISLNAIKKNRKIEIAVEDDGIGREVSRQNRSDSGLVHWSKGMNLTQSRLELNNILQQRQATLEIIDKKDEKGMAAGTKVIIKINEE